MESLRTSALPDSNQPMLDQAQRIWSMLDELAEQNPEGYSRFIQHQMKDGAEMMKPPEPGMCMRTHMVSVDQYAVRAQSTYMHRCGTIDDLQNYCLGTRRGIAVDRPWASCTFQTGNSYTSSFLSGRFLHKIMLQKARRGKEINRGVVDQLFSHLYFSTKMKKAKGCMG